MASKKISPEFNLRIALRRGTDGFVVAECLDMPGCISQGKTDSEALKNLEDVIGTCLSLIVKDWMAKAKAERTSAQRRPAKERRSHFHLRFVRSGAVA